MGTCPDKFGPYFWGTLHLAALFGDDVSSLAEAYTRNLPCPACRVHFTKVLNENPIPKDAPAEKAFLWSVDVHNIVNERLGKPKISYDVAFEKWSKCEKEKVLKLTDFWPFALAILIGFLVLFFVACKK
jgi:hypothetical protein